jgi:aryl-alcohol dehydrogenase-like predicted oxidoreductase
MKIGLGTAQFGMVYGIANGNVQVSPLEVARMLDVAAINDVRYIDTAPLYGESESVLGTLLPQSETFRITTKTPRFYGRTLGRIDKGIVEDTFRASLKRLKRKQAYGLLVHNAEDLLAPGGEWLHESLLELRAAGLVKRIGVSVYGEDEIWSVQRRFAIDLIQLPFSVFDQRIRQSGALRALKQTGIEIHSRSAFLQGALLMKPEDLPAFLQPVRRRVREFQEFAARRGMTPMECALAFCVAIPEIDVVLCGAANRSQMTELCRPLPNIDVGEFSAFAVEDPMVLNPSNWDFNVTR